jgi:type VI secretion system secreted protein VgrG
MPTSDQSYATISLKPPAAGLTLTFEQMTVREELGRPFEIEINAYAETSKTDLTSLLGSSVTVKLLTSSKAQPTYYNGILARIVYLGVLRGGFSYRLELRPWIWLLSRTQDCRIFQDKSPWQIITGLVQEAGFSDAMSDKRSNDSGSTSLDYCVQYRETTFAFITRLMEQYGMYYYFTYADDKHTLVVADDANSHPQPLTIPYQKQTTDMRKGLDHVWEWSADATLQPGMFTFRDYNFQTPAADLTARSSKPGQHLHGTGEIYDYPGFYLAADDGIKLAGIRMEDLAARRQVMGGTTNARSIVGGARFTLSKAPGATADLTYVVISTESSFGYGESSSTTDGELTDTFRCRFRAIQDTFTYRLARATPVPLISGPQTARVVGDSGQEITTDKFGRIKVKFFWDRAPAADQTSSCWIRVSQSWAGNLWGSMVLPRIGQEVIVEFLDGDPDRPIVTGTVYNGTNAVPYPLPDNKTRSTFKSRSSQGGGGFNELRFEDKKDSEEVFFQAQKDYNKVVLNNETVKITQDTTTTVLQGNRAVTVNQGNNTIKVTEGDHSLTVAQGKHTINVQQGDHSMTVGQGKHTTTVSFSDCALNVSVGNYTVNVSAGQATMQAAQSITLQVGASSIKIEPAQITLSSPQISISGEAQVSVSGATVSVAGDAELTLQGGVVMIN